MSPAGNGLLDQLPRLVEVVGRRSKFVLSFGDESAGVALAHRLDVDDLALMGRQVGHNVFALRRGRTAPGRVVARS